jgi:hypothetical protein
MNKSKTIAAIIKRHGSAFIGLTPDQRAALHNAMRAAWTAGNEARPDYDPPTMDGDTSETLTPSDETLARIYGCTLPLPDDIDAMCVRFDEIDAMKREAVMA